MPHRSFIFLSLIASTTILLMACNRQPEAPFLLQSAERLMKSRPDSALLLIDSIAQPKKSLSKKEYMTYLVARVQARYKNVLSISQDTLVFEAKDYFVRYNQDLIQTALACFYSGCVYRERDDFENATQDYKQAEKFAAPTSDVDLKGLVSYNLGDLLDHQGLHAQALQKYKEAKTYYAQSPSNAEEKKARCLLTIGQTHLMLQQNDSCITALNQGLVYAQSAGNAELTEAIKQSLGVAFREGKDYERAKEHLYQSYALNTDTANTKKFYLNFGELYLELNVPDSVAWYAEKVKREAATTNDRHFKAAAYKFLAKSARRAMNYDEAFQYLEKNEEVVDSIREAQLQSSVYEVQKKYDLHLEQERHRQQLTRHRNRIITGGILLALSIVLFLMRRSIHNKKLLLQMYESRDVIRKLATELEDSQTLFGKQISEKQQEIYRLQSEMHDWEQNKTTDSVLNQHIRELTRLYTESNHKKNENIRKLLLWKLNVVAKANNLKEIPGDPSSNAQLKQLKKAVFKENSNDMEKTILSIFDQYDSQLIVKIKEQIPSIPLNQLLVCLLTYVGMSVKEISLLLSLQEKSIQVYRGILRRELNIKDNQTDTATSLRNWLDN